MGEMTRRDDARSEGARDFMEPDPALAVGTVHEGFEVVRVETVEEIGGTCYVMRHVATGARLMWLACPDENRAFAIGFKTPPADDTGVFHIIEHTVLDGSALYPTKEPFVHLLKSSMQTFLNALTYPDKTVYPVASTNVKDLENLMAVYLDAVLDPNIYRRPRIFEQEGWHLELAGSGDDRRLVRNGIVLNEMKGVMQDPDSVLYDELGRALFPDTCYRFESGGDPAAIPTLTYEGFVDAHARHYVLPNSYSFLYGDLDIDRELAFVGSRFDAAPVRDVGAPNPLARQAPVAPAPVRKEMPTTPENACCGVAFVLPDASRETTLAANVLLDALMGSNEAPLKRELLSLGLADDVTGTVADQVLQPYVVFEAKGTRPDAAGRFEGALRDACRRICEAGIDRQLLEASLARIEFELREHDFRFYTDGVAYAVRSLSTWLYDDDDPCSGLRYEDAIEGIKGMLAPGGFERLLEGLVLANPHHAFVEVAPVEGVQGAAEAAELDAQLAAMGPEEIADVEEEAEALAAEQAAPDSPEAIASLPRLTVADVGEAPAEPATEKVEAPFPCVRHAIPTDRICYVRGSFDLSCLAFDELPYASVLADVLGKLGTATRTASELDMVCERDLGSLAFYTSAYCLFDEPDSCFAKLGVSTSVLSEKVEEAARIPAEIWSQTDFRDHDRIRDILTQSKLDLEQLFLNDGHTYAMARSASYFSRKALLEEQLSGVDYYLFLKGLLARFDERFDGLVAKLEDISRRVFRSGNLSVSFTGPSEDLERWLGAAEGLSLLAESAPSLLAVPEPRVRDEAFVVPGNVCYVGETLDLRGTGASMGGTWSVASRVLSLAYLWNEVRVRGGAYGCGFRSYDDGFARLYSYRDPAVDPTLAAYDAAASWLSGWQPSEEELEGFVISTVAGYDAPLKPHQMAIRQDVLRETHHPAGWHDRMRAEALASTADDVRALADTLSSPEVRRGVCVFGGRAPIEASSHGFEVIALMDGGAAGAQGAEPATRARG